MLSIGLPVVGDALQVSLLNVLLPVPSYQTLIHGHSDGLLRLELPGRTMLTCSGSTGPLRIAPSVCLTAAPVAALLDFLRHHPPRVNHIGISLPETALCPPDWQDFITDIAAVLPAYRLLIGSANDVVMVLGGTTALELVLDREGLPPSLHICVEVTARRAVIEQAFPPPVGSCKPGDEDFFYSVGLPLGAALTCYVDFVFAEAPPIDWKAIVTASGQRLAGAPDSP